ncbi:non-ribosomal peptide synthase protein (TIGR01720 family)/amino acid adenylation domain-containing protein [Pedobacter cryoconitis]|uniref:Non-ribosomal peptide synthase protein (TIGR01720 family)/amino acid adenylation domain-containing protein n=1 Tax=Pedobacter cryoconitis TaxID=188932 RepID=A0A327SCZ8_9SPHI|nr:non-ribosomal peptide synthetase [Pedobacter cryoconitis]RAJ26890.1 non-ribosomal peptide synthase protein (TIGR01720 family)/amino acid adenylation domain-containing protein [Pedobacter cryoconitis]
MKVKIEKSNVQEIVELNMVQKGMLYHYLKDSQENLYNVQLAFHIHGELNVDLLQEALNAVQLGNDALRSVFSWEKLSRPLQLILKECAVNFTYLDLSKDLQEDNGDFVTEYLSKDAAKRFDLNALPLRVSVIKVAAHSFILIITHHHILYDGWSTGIILKEIFDCYKQLLNQQRPFIGRKTSYSAIQLAIQQAANHQETLHYWKNYLEGYEITSFFSKTAFSNFTAKSQKIRFTVAGQSLASFSETHFVTKASVIYAAYGLLLQQYFNEPDVTFGTVVSGRDVPVQGIEQVVGNFINTIPLRLTGTANHTLLSVVNMVSEQLIERESFTSVSNTAVRELLQLRPTELLFDSAVVIENYPLDETWLKGLNSLSLELKSVQEFTDIPLMVTVFFTKDVEIELSCKAGYADNLSMASLAHAFKAIINAITDHPHEQVSAVQLLSAAETENLLLFFNNTQISYPRDATVVSLFERQAALIPDKTALIYENTVLTYRSLNNKANQLAHTLRQKYGIGQGHRVAIMAERSEWLVIGLLGILKSGACYVPVDPLYPVERIGYMLEDSEAGVLITSGEVPGTGSYGGAVLNMEEILSLQTENPEKINNPDDLCYTIYTSGSTGKPKGVMITHGNVVNFFAGMNSQLPLQADDCILAVTSTSFDISVLEIFWTLCQGIKVVIHPSYVALNDLDRYLQLSSSDRITLLQSTPSFMQQALESPGSIAFLRSLRLLLMGGEGVPLSLVRDLQQETNAALYNMYGPTETTIWSCVHAFEPGLQKVLVGTPIANTQLYILNKDLQLLPVGAVGDLYIAGDGLSCGYWRRPELTAEKFIANPYQAGSLMYKTSDMARWQADGTVELLGREDNQVKIRGYRVELGEIENSLCAYAGITEAVVTAREENGTNVLVAYYVAQEPVTETLLSGFLMKSLPGYMMPAYYTHLSAMPLTPNGKMDRKALPNPEIKSGDDFVAPAGETEEKLVLLWAEVLAIDKNKISAVHSFFDLGGHSLKMIALVNRILREFNVVFAINQIFEYQDIKRQALYLEGKEQIAYTPILPAPVSAYYPLSSAQKRLYFVYELDQSSTAYNGGVTIMLEGTIHKEHITDVFRKLIDRHEIFRTSFGLNNGHIVQMIADKVQFEITCLTAAEETLQTVIQQFSRPFNLSQAPLIQVALVNIAEAKHLMIIDLHHIIGDGVSQDVLTREFMALYNNEVLPPLVLQYKDYVVWQQEKTQQEKIKLQKYFWKNNFNDLPGSLELPVDFDRVPAHQYKGRAFDFEIGAAETAKLQSLAQGEGTTLFTVLLCAYTIFLGRLGNQEDVIVGTPVAGRQHTDLENMIGMFVNMLALRSRPVASITVKEFLKTMIAHTQACFSQQEFPYEELVDMLGIPRDTSRNPLFDTLFTYQNYKETELQLPGLSLQVSDTAHQAIQFDLVLSAAEKEGKIICRFEYASELFKRDTIQRFAGYFNEIIYAITANSAIKIGDIEIINTEERTLLLNSFNAIKTEYNKEEKIVAIIEQHAERLPDHIAVTFEGKSLTYSQLNQQANALANVLHARLYNVGIPRIAVLFQPSIAMIVAILAVLKAGGVYLPLSPQVAAERNDYILFDSGAALVLVQENMLEDSMSLAFTRDKTAFLPVGENNASATELNFAVPVIPATQPMYIIYTSGTTGVPKGVEVSYNGVLNLLAFYKQLYPVAAGVCFSQVANIYFDASVFEIWPALTNGGCLCIAPEEVRMDALAMRSWLISNNIVITYQVTAIAEYLLNETWRPGESALQVMNVAGDKFNYLPARDLPFKLFNLYGPTEDTVWTTWLEVTAQGRTNGYSIGKPIGNKQIFILDKDLRLQPVGVPGELCIGGEGLALGYINNKALTEKQFVPNPFFGTGRIYKTGDLAKWAPDGEILFLGRKDDQVKIRGFRVEPGEIERHLLAHPAIKEAIVLAREKNGSKYLIAYYVAGETITIQEVRAYLSAKLPDYMVPAFLMVLSSMPLTANGKINRQALPDPDLEAENSYEAPVTPEEQLLVKVWEEVLGVVGIGVTHNFFSTGGDSVKSIQISSRLRELGYKISVKDIFAAQIIRLLAVKLQKVTMQYSQLTVQGSANLSPIQQWFFEGNIKSKGRFNQSVLLRLDHRITKDKVTLIFEQLLAHHDALRLIFKLDGTQVIQENLPHAAIKVEEIDLTGIVQPELEIETFADRLQQHMDLENGVLVKPGLLHLDNGSALLIVIHHLVVDAFSWRILLDDIQTLYLQILEETPLSLPAKTAPFISWPQQLENYSRSTAFIKAASYWNAAESQSTIVPKRDHINGDNLVSEETKMYFSLDEAATASLLTKVPAAFHTQINDILLAALLLSIKRQYQDINGVLLHLEGHGREELDATVDFSRTVGWFTTIYPVYMEYPSDSLPGLIKYVKEILRNIPDNGIGYLVNKYLQTGNRNTSEQEVNARIVFNYLGQGDTDLKNNLFSIQTDAPGNNRASDDNRLYDWDISGIILQKRLQMTIAYSKDQYNDETMQRLMSAYHTSLIELIAYCSDCTKETLTPADVTCKGLTINQLDVVQQQYVIEDVCPLSPMQEGMLFHYLLNPDTENYFEQMTVKIKGSLQVSVVQQTMDALLERYGALRTIFLQEGFSRALQLVLKQQQIVVQYNDVEEACAANGKDEMILFYRLQEREQKFDLSKDALIRLCILKTGKDEYELIWSHHHIIMDGWCLGIILKDFMKLYQGYCSNTEKLMPPVHTYSKYLQWLENRDNEASVNYWSTYLSACNFHSSLPEKAILQTKEKAPAQQLKHQLVLDETLVKKLRQVSATHGITLSTLFQFAWGVLLSRYNNRQESVFGIVTAGRPAEVQGIESMVGLFINTIPVHIIFEAHQVIADVLSRLQAAALDSEAHQYLTLPEILAAGGKDSGLFNHIMVFENYPLSLESVAARNGHADEITISDAHFYNQSSYDLSLTIIPGKEMSVQMDYNASVYDTAIIQQASRHLFNILNYIVAHPKGRTGDIQILDIAEQNNLLYACNTTANTYYSNEETVVSLFEKQATLSPDKPALHTSSGMMCYGELKQLSDKIAGCLLQAGVQRGDLVALLLERETYLVPCILGILKAGAAFIPVDTAYPSQRVRAVINHAKPVLLITREKFLPEDMPESMILFDLDQQQEAISQQTACPSTLPSAKDLAYVIYTSGSTGTPKGVMIEHGSLLNYIAWAVSVYIKGTKATFPLYSSIAFDLTITTIFAPLVSGNDIVVYGGVSDGALLEKVLTDNRSTIIKLTPSHLKMLCAMRSLPLLQDNKLVTLIVGGEDLDTNLAAEVYRLYDGTVSLYNEYGPTEATVGCMIHLFNPEQEQRLSVPIGTPAANTQIYILDDLLQPVPLGVTGEIYIAGEGVARGYLQEELLTQTKFATNPFIGTGQGRMYKTGDMALRLADGNVLFKGRNDTQIKIRGFRIEPGEIEHWLLTYAGIKEAFVNLLDTGDNKNIVAYYVAEHEIPVAELNGFLASTLPKYMVPQFYVQLQSFPLTLNGKLDSSALPQPEIQLLQQYEAPVGSTEQQLTVIWAAVLQTDAENISRYTSFFELGGHSLKAVKLVNKIYADLQVVIPLSEVFTYPDIAGMAERIREKEKIIYKGIRKAEVRQWYPLSSSQKRLYLLYTLDHTSLAYNMPYAVKLTGSLDQKRLESAINRLLERQESLRTAFVMTEIEPVQQVLEKVDFILPVIQAAATDIPSIYDVFVQPFNLEEAPLFRASLIAAAPEEHYLLLDMHHIIMDGVSQEIMIKEFLSLYNEEDLSAPVLQYKDYACWQQSDEQQLKRIAHRDFWLQQFAEDIPVADLPSDYPRPVIQQYEGNTVSFTIDEEVTSRLRDIASRENTTLYMILLTAYYILLGKLSNQEDITVGSPTAGRHHPDVEKMIGIFIHTLPLRNFPLNNLRVQEFLSKVTANTLSCFENEAYQYEELIQDLQVPRNTGRNPLFDTLFVFRKEETSPLSIPGLILSPCNYIHPVSRLDITLMAVEEEKQLSFNLEYATGLYTKDTIERFADYFCRIVNSIATNLQHTIGNIELLSARERDQVIHVFNKGVIHHPEEQQMLLSLFDNQVKKTPENIALRFADGNMTYSSFASQCDNLAGYLQNVKDIAPGDLVAVMLEREACQVLAVFSILKTGAAYVPVDPAYPKERIQAILADAGIKVLITRTRYLVPLENEQLTVVNLDDELTVLQEQKNAVVAVNITADHLAYVMYTSGSAGIPKGVMVTHGALANVIGGLQYSYPLDATGVYLLKTTFSFDVSAAELFGWFLNGGSLYLLPAGEEGNAAAILDSIAQHKITHINFVPSMFAVFSEEAVKQNIKRLSSLQYIFLAGEALLYKTVRKIQELDLPLLLVNLYGPTEGTIYASAYTLPAVGGDSGVPIGKPLHNVKLYVLNAAGHSQPAGVPGELFIAGKGVAAGYLNNPALTEEKFILHPYEPGERLYKTGDLVKWRPDGNLEFLGRIDTQVKLRGFRIELGEIEKQLAAYDDVQEAIVMVWEQDGDKQLVAYYLSEKELDTGLLRKHLLARLPGYMVPAYYMQITKLPLTANGKLNRKALPVPAILSGDDYAAPDSSLEIQLVAIWSDLLKIAPEHISVTKSFFEMGGHSLTATVLINKIKKIAQATVPLRELFRLQTIRELAKYIEQAETISYVPVGLAEVKEYYVLSSAQRRLYFLYELDRLSTAYNMPQAISIHGIPDVEKIESAFAVLINRYESLRTSFEVIDGVPQQCVKDKVNFSLSRKECQSEEINTVISSFIQPFVLNNPPLIRAMLITIPQEQNVLVVDMHHIIADGISQQLLLKELWEAYSGKQFQQSLALQYKDYAEWQSQQLQQERTEKQRMFWLRQFEEEVVFELPADYPRPAVKEYNGNVLHFALSEEQTKKINAIALAAEATPFMVLLSLYMIFLSKISNKGDVVIGTPVAGRSHADLENMVGVFINTIPLRTSVNGELSFRDFLQTVKACVLSCFEHEGYPYETLIEELQIVRDTSRNPLFDVLFMFRNFEEALPGIPGLQLQHFQTTHTLSKFDLTLVAAEVNGIYQLDFEYATSLFKASTIEKFAVYFEHLVANVTAGTASCIADLNILPDHERFQLIDQFNNTELFFPASETIVSLFDAQVIRTPHQVAVTVSGVEWTYLKLQQSANNIATHLIQVHGLGSGQLAGVMLDRDSYLIPSLLGILKTGAAYVPIDPAYPAARIQYILEDSGLKLVLTKTNLVQQQVQHMAVTWIDVTAINLRAADQIDIKSLADATSAAYMIYTSGSSGNPKGVIVTHRNVLNFVYGICEKIDFSVGSTMLCLTTVSFDIFVLETILPLLNGIKIVLTDTTGHKDIQELSRLIREQQVDFIQITPSHLRLLLTSSPEEQVLENTKVLMVGGEAFPPELLNQVKKMTKGRIYNMYGPTETTVWSTLYELTESDLICIGKPIANTLVRILDQSNKLLPLGVSGELCIGGEGVTKGYLNQGTLTAEKFIPDPAKKSGLVYKTGDLARWLPDGNIEFLGRIDDQVKIRGHRIEPGEIAQQLLGHPMINEAVVIAAGEGNNTFLVAYYVPAAGGEPLDVRTYLQEKLPAYMVPAYFMPLDALPLTPNGKLNKRVLPKPVPQTTDNYVAPSGKIAIKLVEIWALILNADTARISVNSNFFEMGGHSLSAIMLMSRIQQEFGVNIPLLNFFKKPTVDALSKEILVASLTRKTDQITEKLAI